jgi:hypothetical protein
MKLKNKIRSFFVVVPLPHLCHRTKQNLKKKKKTNIKSSSALHEREVIENREREQTTSSPGNRNDRIEKLATSERERERREVGTAFTAPAAWLLRARGAWRRLPLGSCCCTLASPLPLL